MSCLFDYMDQKSYRRFDQRNTIFNRKDLDATAPFFNHDMYENVNKIISEDKDGYSQLEFARAQGAWAVYNYFHEAFSWEKMGKANSTMQDVDMAQYQIKDLDRFTAEVKASAQLYGASRVGVTQLAEDWLYSFDGRGGPIVIPQEYQYAIVMIIGMDIKEIKKSPTISACTENDLGYSRMAFLIGCMAQFIRHLGYKAIPMGNNIALSIPLAIAAGLGELGRNGLLITPEFGSCIKICKIFTDMPLRVDQPRLFGVKEFCMKCKLCADACAVGAIQSADNPSFRIFSRSNNRGLRRWAVHADLCYQFWIDNGGECSSCISVCPYSNHKGG